MTNRIDACFHALKQNGQKALIPFITAGDPDLKTTEALVLAMAEAGADIIELGVPFSDPMADGAVIQASSERALEKGTTLPKILKMVERLRKKTQVPILLMGYANPLFVMGFEAFATSAQVAGVDAVLIVDMPPEESGLCREVLKAAGVHMIFLAAPTSTGPRVKLLRKVAAGFVYYVSLTGVTGASLEVSETLKKHVVDVREETELPVCVGFGISTAKQAKAVAAFADGVVVGSALIKIVASAKSPAQKIKKAAEFIRLLRKAI